MVVVNVYRGSELVKTLSLDQLLLRLNNKLTSITSDAKGIAGAKLIRGGKDVSGNYYGEFADSKGNTLYFETPEKPDLSLTDFFLVKKLKGDFGTTIMLIRK